jgi:hypothetical protein
MKCRYWQNNTKTVEVCFTRAVSEYKLLDHQYNADKELKMVAVNTRFQHFWRTLLIPRIFYG